MWILREVLFFSRHTFCTTELVVIYALAVVWECTNKSLGEMCTFLMSGWVIWEQTN